MYKRHDKKADHVSIYLIENKKGETCFVGTMKECLKYMDIDISKINNVYRHLSRPESYGYLNRKYKLTFSHYEKITHKKCRRCGKIKPLYAFPFKQRKNANPLHTNFCKTCTYIKEHESNFDYRNFKEK